MRPCIVVFSVAALAACSSSSSSTPAAPPVCAADAPKTLTVSEGGRLVLTRTGDLANPAATFEGAGVTVTTTDTDITVRVPYRTAAETDLALSVHCASGGTTSIAVQLKDLAWSNLATWQETTGAPAREYGAFWLDAADGGALVVFGGYHYVPKQFTPSNDAWRFDFASGAWSPLAGTLPTMPGSRAALIPDARAVYLFGGSTASAQPGSVETMPFLAKLEFDDTKMTSTPVTNLNQIGGSYTGSFMYDSKRKRWLSVCGVDTAVGINCDVNAYTPENGFQPIEVSGTPPDGRFGFHYAYDEETDRVVLFGGMNGPEDTDIIGDTWALELGGDKAQWKKLFADGAGPTKRRNGAFVLDPIGHRFLLWGGTPDGKNSIPGIQALSLDRGAEAWTDIKTPAEVPSRTSGLGVYDGARHRVVFGFGNGKAVYRDLWTLDVGNGDVVK